MNSRKADPVPQESLCLKEGVPGCKGPRAVAACPLCRAPRADGQESRLYTPVPWVEVGCHHCSWSCVVGFLGSLGTASWELSQDVCVCPCGAASSRLECHASAPVVPRGLVIGMLGAWSSTEAGLSRFAILSGMEGLGDNQHGDDTVKRGCKD